jgi:hypothetical protein
MEMIFIKHLEYKFIFVWFFLAKHEDVQDGDYGNPFAQSLHQVV